MEEQEDQPSPDQFPEEEARPQREPWRAYFLPEEGEEMPDEVKAEWARLLQIPLIAQYTPKNTARTRWGMDRVLENFMDSDFGKNGSDQLTTLNTTAIFAWHQKVEEARRAAGFPETDGKVNLVATLLAEETTEFMTEFMSAMLAAPGEQRAKYIAAALQEASDIIYIVAQGLFYLGVSAEELNLMVAAVTAANETKLREGGTFREDGKLTKGPHYSREVLNAMLDRVVRTHSAK
jgi:hypothetical protein